MNQYTMKSENLPIWQLARKLVVSPRLVAMAKKVTANGHPQLRQAVLNGEVRLNTALGILKRPYRDQPGHLTEKKLKSTVHVHLNFVRNVDEISFFALSDIKRRLARDLQILERITDHSQVEDSSSLVGDIVPTDLLQKWAGDENA